MIYFTSDPHFSHRNILEFCSRPFKNVKEMNQTIIDNYCSVIKEEDEVYFLGDLTMSRGNQYENIQSIMEKLPGTKHLILGNHDHFKPFFYTEALGFTSVHTALKAVFSGQEFYLAHDPAFAQIKDSVWLCGHIHNLFKSTITNYNAKIINVGVDVNDFMPVSLDQIFEELKCLVEK